MKYLRLSLFVILTLLFLTPSSLKAQGGFNPGNPPSPGSIFRLTVVSNMAQAATFTLTNKAGEELTTVNGTNMVAEVPAGENVYLAITNRSENITIESVTTDEGVELQYNSTAKGYAIKMPNHAVTVTVNFGTAQPIIPNGNYFDANTGTLHLDYFAPGTASNTANNAVGTKSQISALRVAGPITDDDYKAAKSSWSSCALIDYSRTNGGRIVPKQSFSSLKTLNAVILPACVDSITPQAFYSCTALASVTCFAMVPPRVSSKTNSSPFYNCTALKTIFVPEEAVEFYQAHEVWGKYDIQPINEGIVTLEVSLPEECKDSRCKGLYMELKDKKSGYDVTYLCNERLRYTFYYLPNNADYSVRLYEKKADPQIECAAMDIPVKEDDVKVTLENIRYKKYVNVHIFDADDKEVRHYDEGNHQGFHDINLDIKISKSNVQHGRNRIFWYEGETISAYISGLSPMFAMFNQLPSYTLDYVIPHEDESDWNIKFDPLDLKEYTLSGYIKDANTGLPISGADVTVGQHLNEYYAKRLHAETNEEGFYSLNVYMRDIEDITFSAKNYMEQRMKRMRHDVAEGETVTLDDITMEPNAKVLITYNYKEASADGSKEAMFKSSNLSFKVKNLTTGEDLTCVQTASGTLIINEPVNVGDELSITINSTAKVFDAVEVTGKVMAGHMVMVQADIVQNGGINTTVKTTENKEVVAMLFAADGSLVDKYPMTTASLSINELPTGTYSLVMMGRSDLYNSFNTLEQFDEAELTEGKDYVKQTVNVESGKITETSFALVPFFNENRERYLSSASYFNTLAKASAGSYITLYANTSFEEAYKNGATNVVLDITIPRGLQYVAGTAMTAPVGAVSGKLIPGATADGNTLHIPLTTPAYAATPLTRLCVLPEIAGNYTMTACVRFEYKGRPITAPLGDARLEVQDMGLTIDIDDEINSKKFDVTGSIGTAYVKNASIYIYDDETPIGTAHINNGGGWTAECELKTAYNLSKHNIYAKLNIDGVYAAQSEVKEVTYNIDADNKLSMVNMFYTNLSHNVNYVIKYDYITKEKPDYYRADGNYKHYDFTIDFIDNDPEKITDVQLFAMDTLGEWYEAETSWNERRKTWIASYDVKGKSPITNVAVEYNYLGQHRMDEHGVKMYTSGLDVTYKKAEEEKENLKAVVDEIQKDLAEADKKYQQAQEIIKKLDRDFDIDEIDQILEICKEFNAVYGIEDISEDVEMPASYEELTETRKQHLKEAEELLASIKADESISIDDINIDEDIQELLKELENTDQVVEKISDDEYRVSIGGFIYTYRKCKLSEVNLSNYYDVPLEIAGTDGKTYKKYIGIKESCFVDEATGEAWIEEFMQDDNAPALAKGDSGEEEKGFWAKVGDTIGGALSFIGESIWDNLKSKFSDARNAIVNTANYGMAIYNKYLDNVKEQLNKATAELNRWNDKKIKQEEHIEYLKKYRKAFIEDCEKTGNYQKFYWDELDKTSEWHAYPIASERAYINDAKWKLSDIEWEIRDLEAEKKKIESKLKKGKIDIGKYAKIIGNVTAGISCFNSGYEFSKQINADITDMYEWHDLINSIPEQCPNDQVWADQLREHLEDLWSEIYPVYIASDVSSFCGLALSIMSNFDPGNVGSILDTAYDLIAKSFADEFHKKAQKLSNNYKNTNKRAINNLKCYDEGDPLEDHRKKWDVEEPKKNPNNAHPGGGSNVIIDPSGYVFEAVTDNRVEGATATIYYREKDKQTNEWNEVLWDAAEYAQKNPLFTDAEGMYRWDVPVGEWQVRINKDGYNETRSEWLPVPPPQLDVNLPLVSYEQPEVTAAHAYKDGVELTFSKYMDPAYFTTSNIYVTTTKDSKRQVLTDLSIEPIDAKAVSTVDATTYATQWFFKTNQDLSQVDEATVSVRPRLRSYAGIPLNTAFSQALDIEERVKELLADSVYYVPNDQSTTIKVAALPANAVKGRKMTITSGALAKLTLGNSDAPDFVGDKQEVVFDENGEASFTVNALLPGISGISYDIEGTDLKQYSIVSVMDPSQIGQTVAAPKASRISGTELYRGQTVTLTADSKDAVIYYTLDGSCPCDNTKRLVYKNPIVVSKPVTIKAMAVAKDMTESEISTFNYGIRQTSLNLDFAKGWNWASHNSEEALNVESIAENTLVVRTEQGESQLTAVGVKGNVSEVDASEAMKVQASAATTHRITGDEYNPSAQLIALHDGWNWLGYPLSQTMATTEALSLLDADEGDVICSPDGFATYENGKWDGSLNLLAPGKGYLYKSNAQKTFIYNNTFVSNAKARAAGGITAATPWTVDKYAYPNVMCVAATIDLENMPTADDTYTVAAFCGEECRGIAEASNGKYYITVIGNQDEEISFYALSADKQVYEFINKEAFKADIIGSRTAPYVLTLNATGIDSVDARTQGNDNLYDLIGRKINANTKRPGIYITRGQKVVKK